MTLLSPYSLNATPLSGGDATVFVTGKEAFSLPSVNMPLLEKLDFNVGNSFFRNPWIPAPATTTARDGLGPLMNTNACQNCHIKDGRGHAPANLQDNAVSLLVRLSLAESTENKRLPHQGVIPEPNYGGQLQDFSIPNVQPEGRVQIHYTPVDITFMDGERLTLRQPTLTIDQLAYGELHPDTQLSARIASPMIGLGLLEAIPEANILASQDIRDKNLDGISGKANWVWDQEQQTMTLGRFGWKAGQPSVKQQNAAAFNGDLGITSVLFNKDDCTAQQSQCVTAPNGGEFELSNNILRLVTFYSQNLGVPARRNLQDPSVIEGEKIFNELGCANCHTTQWQTGADYPLPWLANQTIHPYTDMLLHNMGEGLADHRGEFSADGFEWRTPPLWGIGLTQAVSAEAGFLHDGRARTITEAIAWHGGEAASSQQRFLAADKARRSALLAFLDSL